MPRSTDLSVPPALTERVHQPDPRASLFLFVGMLLSLFSAAPLPAAEKSALPNIVFIIADDLGYGELGCFGQTKIRTPHLDRMAAEGLRLTQHYSGNAVCAPSRCVLMTGRHAGQAEIRNNKSVQPEGQQPITAEAVTLAELLKAQGYKTGAFGKWGLGPMHSTGDPLTQGFDRFLGFICQSLAHNYYPKSIWNDHEQLELTGNTRGLTGKHYVPDLAIAGALEFLEQNQKDRFFLYYPTTVPHVALQVPDDSLAEYAGAWEDPPYEGNRGYLPHPTPRAAYAAMVTRLDRDVGRILNKLQELGLDEQTIVVFTSDNGPAHNGVGGSDSEFFASSGGLRGQKGALYEGGIRVPTIVRWPGRITAGRTSDHISMFDDWLPTLLELAGAAETVPADVTGLSLVPLLLGERDQPQREFLYWEFPGYGGQQAVRKGNWKLVRRSLTPRRRDPQSATLELFDLSQDRNETRNLAEEHPEIVSELQQLAQRVRTPSSVFPFPPLDEE